MTYFTREDWRARLESLPEPLTDMSPWDAKEAGLIRAEDAYQLAGELTAKAMLTCVDADPALLDIPPDISDGWQRAMHDAAWLAAKERYPGLDDWLGGVSLNMFGWANQLVRYIHDAEPVGNPALVTITIEGDQGMKIKTEYEPKDIDLSGDGHQGDPVHDFIAGLVLIMGIQVVTMPKARGIDDEGAQQWLRETVALVLNFAADNELAAIVRREP